MASRIKRLWKEQFPGRGKPKLTDEQKEIALLKKQLKDISEEHEILKKVVNPKLQLAHHLKDTLYLYILSSPRATSKVLKVSISGIRKARTFYF